MKKMLRSFGLGAVAVVSTGSAFAAGPDLSPLTGAIDVSTVITAVLATAVIGIGLILASGGATKVMGFVSRVLNSR